MYLTETHQTVAHKGLGPEMCLVPTDHDHVTAVCEARIFIGALKEDNFDGISFRAGELVPIYDSDSFIGDRFMLDSPDTEDRMSQYFLRRNSVISWGGYERASALPA